MTVNQDLLTAAIEHLHGLTGHSTGLTGQTRLTSLLLGHKILGHRTELRHGLSLTAAGAESHCASNGNNESGEFHKRVWLCDSDAYSSKFTQKSQQKFPFIRTFPPHVSQSLSTELDKLEFVVVGARDFSPEITAHIIGTEVPCSDIVSRQILIYCAEAAHHQQQHTTPAARARFHSFFNVSSGPDD